MKNTFLSLLCIFGTLFFIIIGAGISGLLARLLSGISAPAFIFLFILIFLWLTSKKQEKP